MSALSETAKQDLSFVIPCYRSERTIEWVIQEIIEVTGKLNRTYEIIAVDDNSPDHVYDVLAGLARENRNIKVIHFSKNFGQHAGLMAGIRSSVGDVVVVLDDDGQCPLDHLSDLILPLEKGWDIAIAQYGRKKQSFFKNVCSNLNEIAANILVDKPKDLQMGNFMAFKRFIADEISRYAGPYPYLSGLLFRSSGHLANVPMQERARMEGGTTYTLRKLFSLWLNSFTAFSIKPLRFASLAGMVIAAVGFFYGAVIIVQKLANPAVAVGWSSLVVLQTILGGLILLVLGLIGEYLGRIYMSINQTPQYVIDQTINF